MKLEAGKFYLNAAGNKRGPMRKFCIKPAQFDYIGSTYFFDENGISMDVDEPDLIAEWTDTPSHPETGTLAELNVQPGDVVEWIGEYMRERDCIEYTIGSFDGKVYRAKGMPEYNNLNPSEPLRIISRASQSTTPTSPVRTVTRKEIVPGVYGRVTVEQLDNGDWRIEVKSMRTADDITAAMETLTQIRGALENP